jgi:hypothetical protein
MRVESEPERLSSTTLTVQARTAGLYVLVALMLLVALTLVALPAETSDERWIRVGGLMAAAGLAVWLPLWCLPLALIGLWSMPLLARELFGEASTLGWLQVVELASLLFIGIGCRVEYLAAALRLSHGRTRVQMPTKPALRRPHSEAEPRTYELLNDPLAAPTVHLPLGPTLPTMRASWPGAGNRISEADAAALLRRFQAIDIEVRITGDLMRAASTTR